MSRLVLPAPPSPTTTSFFLASMCGGSGWPGADCPGGGATELSESG